MTLSKLILNRYNQLFLAGLLTLSCTDNFDKINSDPYKVDEEMLDRDGYVVGAAFIKLQNYVVPNQPHLYQVYYDLGAGAYAGYAAGANNGFTLQFATFNPNSSWTNRIFEDALSYFYPSYIQLNVINKDEVLKNMAELLRIATYQPLTDAFGPIPYSKVGSTDQLSSEYDSQRDLYFHLIESLDNIILFLNENINADASTYASSDQIFKGNIRNWIKYANSLKLRMAVRMSYAEPAHARRIAEEAVNHPVGVISANNENAMVPSTWNPRFVVAGEWNDSRVGADIITYMNGYHDPRRETYFNVTTFSDPAITNGYCGYRSGVNIDSKDVVGQYSSEKVAVTDPVILFCAAEAAFLQAEGALRGWNMNSSAESLYNEGIRLSFDQFGVSGAEDYISDNQSLPAVYDDPLKIYSASTPMSNITIKWEESGFEKNLERIITQKWIANYKVSSVESWAEKRRTGYPKLLPVLQNNSGGLVSSVEGARRFAFPESEYRTNKENVMKATLLLGGPDNQGTKLWWDKK